MVEPQYSKDSKKRKRDFSAPKTKGKKNPKKLNPKKLQSSNAPQEGFTKPVKFNTDKPKEEPEAKEAKTLEQELSMLWEKMQRRDISEDNRSTLVTEALIKMKGKIPDIASSPVLPRVLQTCLSHCSKRESNALFDEIRPQMFTLATSPHAVYLVINMLKHASSEQRASLISSLRGRVASLLRHPAGSLAVEHAYSVGNSKQKQSLLVELYSPELRLFRDLASVDATRVVDVISKLQLQKSSVVRHMAEVIQPVLEKKILDHSITHRVIAQYLTIADKSAAADVIQQLSGEDLVRMIHTKDGSNIGILCVRHGAARERKKIIQGMKGLVQKFARDRYGTMVLVSLLSTVDDTRMLSNVITREYEDILNEAVLDQHARRPLLQLLHPNCSRYFHPDILSSLNSSIPSMITNDDNKVAKKDPLTRRKELLIRSGLAEKLVKVCFEMAEDLLRSNFGKEVIYEVITGGADDILHPEMDEKLGELCEKIAYLVAEPKSRDGEEIDHLLEDFHSSRAIRRLILDCPAFASKLWEIGLKGKCAQWAEGHSSKVICAFLETSDKDVRRSAKKELQPLIDTGVLKLPAKYPGS